MAARTEISFENGKVNISNHAFIAKVKKAANVALVTPAKSATHGSAKHKNAAPALQPQEQKVSAIVTFTNAVTLKAGRKLHGQEHCDMVVDVRC